MESEVKNTIESSGLAKEDLERNKMLSDIIAGCVERESKLNEIREQNREFAKKAPEVFGKMVSAINDLGYATKMARDATEKKYLEMVEPESQKYH